MKKPNYKIKRSKRKSISIEIESGNDVVVRVPLRMKEKDIERFKRSHKNWVLKKLAEKERQDMKLEKYNISKESAKKHKMEAKNKITKMVAARAKEFRIRYKKIRISNARKRWGSCSTKGTISINWRLTFAPKEILDYVIVHELLHLKHMNHSKRYWQAVEGIVPDYKEHKRWLKEHEYVLKMG